MTSTTLTTDKLKLPRPRHGARTATGPALLSSHARREVAEHGSGRQTLPCMVEVCRPWRKYRSALAVRDHARAPAALHPGTRTTPLATQEFESHELLTFTRTRRHVHARKHGTKSTSWGLLWHSCKLDVYGGVAHGRYRRG